MVGEEQEADDLWWRFEMRLPSRPDWVPITREVAGDHFGCMIVGKHDQAGIYRSPSEFAARELDD